MIDGANNFNGVDGGLVLKPPIDDIAELRILTHNSNAEFGTSVVSTTNIITKSGSNLIHDALWEVVRNDKLDATRCAGTDVEPLKQHDCAGSVGGPVRRD